MGGIQTTLSSQQFFCSKVSCNFTRNFNWLNKSCLYDTWLTRLYRKLKIGVYLDWKSYIWGLKATITRLIWAFPIPLSSLSMTQLTVLFRPSSGGGIMQVSLYVLGVAASHAVQTWGCVQHWEAQTHSWCSCTGIFFVIAAVWQFLSWS
jgi:hypothetical protein